jgi:DNA-binding transcriptional ArsR family regulator
MRKGVNFRALERIVKGFANHRRLQIVAILSVEPELSVEDITERLHTSYENTSDHLRKLAIAGIVLKRSDGPHVRHKLSERGEYIQAFCKMLE